MTQKFLLLPDEYSLLQQKYQSLEKELKEAGERAGEACAQWAETWHDNFDLEDAQRVMGIVSAKIREVSHILQNARIVSAVIDDQVVSVGKRIEIIMEDGSPRILNIGGYQTTIPGRVGYNSPIVSPLMGLKPGEIGDLEINDYEQEVEVLRVDLSQEIVSSLKGV